MTPILDETNNILALYEHHVGRTKIPIVLHHWACLAGIAACLEDRVWIAKSSRHKITPEIITFLIGPSAVGKSAAISRLMPYMKEADVNVYAGEITAQKLQTYLSGKPQAGRRAKSKVFLVTDEMVNCVGQGPQARSFITRLTMMSTWMRGIPLRKGTITGANAVIYDPSINWFAGTTLAWMLDHIPTEVILGGFLGRLLPVWVGYGEGPPRDILPPDHDAVEEHLFQRFCDLATLTGPFKMTMKARELETQWVSSRPVPDDERLRPTYYRSHDQMLKLAMLFACCESCDRIVRSRHVVQAIAASNQAYKAAKLIIQEVTASDETRKMRVVERTIKDAGTIGEPSLLKKVYSLGVTQREMKEALQNLRAMGAIRVDRANHLERKRPLLLYTYRRGGWADPKDRLPLP